MLILQTIKCARLIPITDWRYGLQYYLQKELSWKFYILLNQSLTSRFLNQTGIQERERFHQHFIKIQIIKISSAIVQRDFSFLNCRCSEWVQMGFCAYDLAESFLLSWKIWFRSVEKSHRLYKICIWALLVPSDGHTHWRINGVHVDVAWRAQNIHGLWRKNHEATVPNIVLISRQIF